MDNLYAFDVYYSDNKAIYYLYKYFDTEGYEYYGDGEDNSNKTIYIPLKNFGSESLKDLMLDYFTNILIECMCNIKTIAKSNDNTKIIKEYLKENIIGFDIDRIYYRELLCDNNKINYAYRYVRILFDTNNIINTKGIKSFDNEIIQLFSN